MQFSNFNTLQSYWLVYALSVKKWLRIIKLTDKLVNVKVGNIDVIYQQQQNSGYWLVME